MPSLRPPTPQIKNQNKTQTSQPRVSGRPESSDRFPSHFSSLPEFPSVTRDLTIGTPRVSPPSHLRFPALPAEATSSPAAHKELCARLWASGDSASVESFLGLENFSRVPELTHPRRGYSRGTGPGAQHPPCFGPSNWAAGALTGHFPPVRTQHWQFWKERRERTERSKASVAGLLPLLCVTPYISHPCFSILRTFLRVEEGPERREVGKAPESHCPPSPPRSWICLDLREVGAPMIVSARNFLPLVNSPQKPLSPWPELAEPAGNDPVSRLWSRCGPHLCNWARAFSPTSTRGAAEQMCQGDHPVCQATTGSFPAWGRL